MYLDKEEMKFAALYTIKQYKAPLNMSRIYEILTWDREVMEYFELSEVLMELLEDGYILKKYYRNEEAYSLTEKGADAHKFFNERIPYSIRKRIDDAIGKLRFEEVADPNAIRAEVVPVADNQYAVRFSILDNKNLMLELSLNMGTNPQAQDTAAYLKENAREVYQEILKICVPENKKD